MTPNRIKRIVFFQPRTFAGRNYMNSGGAEQTWTPWFALLLAPSAQRAGLTVDLIDARTDSNWEKRLAGLQSTDLLACSVLTGNAIVDAVAASSLAQRLGAKVVWGGPHVTLFPDETLREAPVDAVVPGFGVSAFEELTMRLSASPWPFPTPTVVQCGCTHVVGEKVPVRNDLTAAGHPSSVFRLICDETGGNRRRRS